MNMNNNNNNNNNMSMNNCERSALLIHRKEIIRDLSVPYIMEYLVVNSVLNEDERTIILSSTGAGHVKGGGDSHSHDELDRVRKCQCEKMLDILLRKSSKAFDKFILALYHEDNYPWLAKELQKTCELEKKKEREENAFPQDIRIPTIETIPIIQRHSNNNNSLN